MSQNSKKENNKKSSNTNAPKIENKKNDSIKPPTIVITDNTKNNTSNKNLLQMTSKSPDKKRSDLSKKALPQIVKKQNKNFLQIPGMEPNKKRSNSKIIKLNPTNNENSPPENNNENNNDNNDNNKKPKSRKNSLFNSPQQVKFPLKRKSILDTFKENLIETLEKDKNIEINDSNSLSFISNKTQQTPGVNKGVKLTAMPKNINENKDINSNINYQKSVRNAVMLRRLEFTERLKKGMLGGKSKKKSNVPPKVVKQPEPEPEPEKEPEPEEPKIDENKVILIQKNYRGYISRKKYFNLKNKGRKPLDYIEFQQKQKVSGVSKVYVKKNGKLFVISGLKSFPRPKVEIYFDPLLLRKLYLKTYKKGGKDSYVIKRRTNVVQIEGEKKNFELDNEIINNNNLFFNSVPDEIKEKKKNFMKMKLFCILLLNIIHVKIIKSVFYIFFNKYYMPYKDNASNADEMNTDDRINMKLLNGYYMTYGNTNIRYNSENIETTNSID